MQFYSQFGEDKWLYENGYLGSSGYYVDVGCAHPTHISNTALLRDLGWMGLNIDADPRWIESWHRAGEHLTLATIGLANIARFNFSLEPQASGIVPDGGTLVCCTKLAYLVEQPIDLLSLDVEGNEYEAWLSLGELKPKLAIFEWLTLGKRSDKLLDYVLANGYELLHTTEANHIIKHGT